MARYKLTVEYDGTGIAGWQRQPDAPSVQDYLEQAIAKLTAEDVVVIGAGRTDAGVHATGQVAHVDITRTITPHNIMHGINFHLIALTPQVIVTNAEEVSEEFNARFSATGRRYLYRIINRPARLALGKTHAWHVPEALDARVMHEAAQLLVGTYDFSTFRDSKCQSKSPVKTLRELNVEREGEMILIHVESRSFLHHQVRNFAGALRRIGNGKWSANDLQHALQACDRTKGAETAPAFGLYLREVSYEKK